MEKFYSILSKSFNNLFAYNPDESVLNASFEENEIVQDSISYRSSKPVDLASQLRSKIEAYNELEKVFSDHHTLFK